MYTAASSRRRNIPVNSIKQPTFGPPTPKVFSTSQPSQYSFDSFGIGNVKIQTKNNAKYSPSSNQRRHIVDSNNQDPMR